MFEDLMVSPEGGAAVSEEQLLKSLLAGYGTDAAQFTGGRALQAENCEAMLVNVMREQQDDFKLMNTLKKRLVVFNFGNEYAYKDIKYIQKYGSVSEQAIQASSYANAYDEEKLATTLSVLRTAEAACFHGDSSVIPKEWDGILAQVKKAPIDKRNVLDLRGQSIETVGEGIFMDMATMIADKGGAANKALYPLILGDAIQALCRDRLRFGSEDERMATVFKSYPTLYGSISIAGDDAGPDKLFFPKNVVKPDGDMSQLPNPPSSVTATVAANPASRFLAGDAGDYLYTVHAVSEYGIGVGKPLDAAVAVASAAGVTLSITPAAINGGTGFVICRSAKDGSQVMEMTSIGRDTLNEKTTFVDINEDLPGTAEMLFLTEKKIQTVVEFLQFLPMRLFPLPPTRSLTRPFVMALWGTPMLKVPGWCGVIKNIQYKGGLTF